jgi:type II restriction enzyme
MQTGNLGEWSEVYAFLKILHDGEVSEVDSNLVQKKSKVRFRDIIRDDSSGIRLFPTRQDSYGSGADRVERAELEEALTKFRMARLSARTPGAFTFPPFSELMSRLGITKIKSSSKNKVDLEARIVTNYTDEDPTEGFSIKSELGSPATLVNAGAHTAFQYRIETNLSHANELAASFPRSEVRGLITQLRSKGIVLEPCGPRSQVLSDNLKFFGEDTPDLMSRLLLSYYSGEGKSLWALTESMGLSTTPLSQARYKVGQFLRAAALGLRPATPWSGFQQAHGGFIVVKKDGLLGIVSARSEDDFRSYLLRRSYLDTPSTSRHGFGFVYGEVATPYIDLNLQVRFASSNFG